LDNTEDQGTDELSGKSWQQFGHLCGTCWFPINVDEEATTI